jgi:AcrR family transcriptional regulator
MKAAIDLFADEGFDAVGVERLRAQAGVSNGSFFHQFATKEDLAADLLVDCVIDYQSAVLHALERCAGAAAGVEAIVRAHIRWVITNRRKARFMLDDARAAWFAKAAGRLRDHNLAFAAAIDRWRAPLVERGVLRDVSTEVFLATLVGPANLICRTWIGGRKLSSASPARSESELVALALQALVTTPPRAAARSVKHAS